MHYASSYIEWWREFNADTTEHLSDNEKFVSSFVLFPNFLLFFAFRFHHFWKGNIIGFCYLFVLLLTIHLIWWSIGMPSLSGRLFYQHLFLFLKIPLHSIISLQFWKRTIPTKNKTWIIRSITPIGNQFVSRSHHIFRWWFFDILRCR